MAISSQGIGSGLDVNSIVSQLVAIEKQPLQPLQLKATTLKAQLSLYGTVKSQASTLGDMAALLGGASGWNIPKASSSNASAVTVTASATAAASSISVEVSQLARAQSAGSAGILAGTAAGASGNLTIELGAWTDALPPVFTPGSSLSVAVDAADTLTAIAAKINATANVGVTATVLRDGPNERLVIRSNSSGTAAGFRVAAPAIAGALGLTNPSDGVNFVGQSAQDAKVKINGVSVVSATNKMTDVLPGVTLQLTQTTSAPVEVTVENDLDAVQKNIQNFVDAYNAMNQTLADATKYDGFSKKGGLLQGDSTTVGLQNTLRAILGSSSTGSSFSRLSEIGIERQADGSLKLNATKLKTAMQDMDNLKKLFTTNNGDAATNGFGLKVRDFARGLVASDGRVTNKSTALQGSITRNSTDQERVNDRAARVEVALRRQYTALDRQMAQMTGLSSYVTAQLAQWNKPTQ